MNNTNEKINIFWFRRDLRIDDNTGLFHALQCELPVLPIFIFDSEILSNLEKTDSRLAFISEQINRMKAIFEKNGSSFKIFFGKPIEIFQSIVAEYSINTVFTNRDYEPYALKRDRTIASFLETKGVGFLDFKDQVIFDRNDIVKDNQQAYTIFTPYMRKWKSKLSTDLLDEFPSQQLLHKLYKTQAFEDQSLDKHGFYPNHILVPNFDISDELLHNYAHMRDFPSKNGTSRLSVHLRFGTVSIRKLTKIALPASEVFLNELIWRNFYMDILWHFPHVEKQSFKRIYDRIEWRNNEAEFEKWCYGETGYPLVDAGMRELNQTGYMHNRVRMVVAGFLCKHLLVDWRWGEAYFAEKLLDYEMASNNGGWQWAAGSGCDAAPYFRVFNPILQAQKFDREAAYIRKWIPEYGSLNYPLPIVEHSFARNRAIETYKRVLSEK